jgi:hypothetical protein
MRHHFIVPASIASRVVAVPLLFAVTFSYVSRLFKQTGPEIYTLGMTAFGVTAALSAICLTIPSASHAFPPTRYAGEKFLHSSLLLIQTLMIVYVRNALVQSAWWNAHHNLGTVASVTLSILGSLVSAAAAYAWYFGFEALNDELWSNWDRRLREMEPKKSKSNAASAGKN